MSPAAVVLPAKIVPPSGESRPAISFKSVLLPHPLLPAMQVQPSCNWSEKSSNRTVWDEGYEKESFSICNDIVTSWGSQFVVDVFALPKKNCLWVNRP